MQMENGMPRLIDCPPFLMKLTQNKGLRKVVKLCFRQTMGGKGGGNARQSSKRLQLHVKRKALARSLPAEPSQPELETCAVERGESRKREDCHVATSGVVSVEKKKVTYNSVKNIYILSFPGGFTLSFLNDP